MTTLAPSEPVIYGPTWKRDASGKFILPERTLGWTVIDWAERSLLQPDGPDAGTAWRFTKEQQRLLLWWYAVDERGRFLKRSGMLRRMKGWGKDPFAAALACVEFVGPCRFDGWDRNGESKVAPHSAAWIQIAAVSKEQTRNTMTLFPGMLSKETIAEHGIDLGKEIIYAYRGQRRIEAVTSSPRAIEGGRPTFSIKNESQHWLESNEGIQMSATMKRNSDKSRDGSSRELAISNAHAPGEGSDAEADYEAWIKIEQAGLADVSDFLYDSIEAPEDVDIDDPESVRRALEICRGDSYWLDVERLTTASTDKFRRSESQVRRFYLNQVHASEDRAFPYARWLELVDRNRVVEEGALITLGFDGSINDDWTVLIATEVATGYQWPIGIWKPEQDDEANWHIDTNAVNAAVEDAFERYRVWRLNADPYFWTEQLANWAGKFDEPGERHVISWPTTNLKKTAFALLAYRNAIQAGDVKHGDVPDFNAGIENAYKKEQSFVDDKGDFMWTIRKERALSPLKIDPAMGAALSWEAREAAIAAGVLNEDDEVHFTWL